jgi:hypothetical protein
MIRQAHEAVRDGDHPPCRASCSRLNSWYSQTGSTAERNLSRTTTSRTAPVLIESDPRCRLVRSNEELGERELADAVRAHNHGQVPGAKEKDRLSIAGDLVLLLG